VDRPRSRRDHAAIDAAITLNGTAIAMNRAAFAWGRQLAVDAGAVHVAAGLIEPVPETLDALIDRRAAFLTGYQDAAYAERYRHAIRSLAAAEARVGGEDAQLARAAAQALFRLMAYKDEYEVARLYTDSSFVVALQGAFETRGRLSFYMAPPILARRDRATGHLRKRRFGPWLLPMLKVLARGKRLRGTRFDPFGRSAERRAERTMIVGYEALLVKLEARLTPANVAAAADVAAAALEIRGYGHVKDRAMAAYPARLDTALRAFDRTGEAIANDKMAGAG
jgi:indolepyruvate ferredoxin oxidoreductase